MVKRSWSVCWLFIFGLLSLFQIWGCSGQSYHPQDDIDDFRMTYNDYQEQTKPAETEYILHTGDELEITSFYNQELNSNVIIRPDGLVSLKLLGDIKAGGLTSSKFRQIILEKYSKIIRNPEINVNVKNFTHQRIYVGGEVVTPQIVNLGSGKTTLQAIFEVGGFRDTAEMRSILILRGIGEPNFRVIKVDLMKLFLSKRLVKNDIQLQPNDVVYVPKTLISKVNQFVDQYMNRIIPSQVFTDLIRGK